MAATGRLVVTMVVCLLVAVLAEPGLGAPRKVLFEQFTNDGCIPCALVAPDVHRIMVDYDEVLVPVVWHTWWPNPSDPLYLHNPDPIDRQVHLYGVTGVPGLRLDGVEEAIPIPAYEYLARLIDHRMAVPSPLVIDVAVKVTAEGVLARVNVTVETPTYTHARLYVALAEKYIHWLGPSGQEDHYWTFRRINNNDGPESGQYIDLSAPGLQQFEYDATDFPMHPEYQPTEMAVCAWVQRTTTLDVVQAGKGDSPYVADIEYDGLHTRIGAANEVVQYGSLLHNRGISDDIYDLTVSGVPAGWAYSYTTPEGTFSGPSSLPLQMDDSASITIDLDSQGHTGPATITLTCTSQNDPRVSLSLDFYKLNGMDVLVVDDDGGVPREELFGEALDEAGAVWGLWDREWGDLDTTDLETAAAVTVWQTGDHVPTLTEPDRDAISGFLDNGGELFLSGQEIAFDLMDTESPNVSPATMMFFLNYLHGVYGSTYSGSFRLTGTAGDEIGDGMAIDLRQGGEMGQLTPDAIGPGLGADLVFTYDGVPPHGAIKWTDGSAHLVYFAFGFEGIISDQDRLVLMQRILYWFRGTTAVDSRAAVAPQLLLSQNVPNPFRPPASTTITYELAAAGPVRLRVYDLEGRVVRALVDDRQGPERHSVSWDGRDAAGCEVASGVYFYRLETASGVETRRMVLAP